MADDDQTESKIVPAPDMTRAEFIAKARNLLDDMEADHEEMTGIEDSELLSWEEWSIELTNAYLNS